MGLRSFIKKQFIDAIEWDWQDDDVLMWKFPMADNEIQNGATLTVRDGQVAVFVNEGQIADVFTAGRYTLTTETLPVMTNPGMASRVTETSCSMVSREMSA